MAGELVAVEGDLDSHGDGALHPSNNNPDKLFVQGKLVALIGSNADEDLFPHTPAETKPGTGTDKLYVNGIKVHRNGDLRDCLGSTIVSNQDKLYST